MTPLDSLGALQQLVMLAALRLGDDAYGARIQEELGLDGEARTEDPGLDGEARPEDPGLDGEARPEDEDEPGPR